MFDEIGERGEIIIKTNSVGNYCYFVNNGEFFYIGQKLRYFDLHGNYLKNVEIIKFIKHYRRIDKTPYTCVQVRFLDGCKTHVYTFNATDFLGKHFTNKNFHEVFLFFNKKAIDKNRE